MVFVKSGQGGAIVHISEMEYKELQEEHIDNMTNVGKFDPVNKPEHYNKHQLQPWDVAAAWDLDFFCGNVLKYIYRHKYKGNPIQDLEKARQYIERKIDQIKEFEKIDRDAQ